MIVGEYTRRNVLIPVLKIKNVSKVYGKKKVVDSLSFSLFPGQVFGFIGPNGAGKSTTIKMICGLTSISGGAIYVDGYNVERCFKKAIANVGAVIESPQLYPYMSGYENLKLFAKFYGKKALKRIPNIMKLTKMTDFANKKVSTYSLGMKQRLGIAQALLNKPKLLILDEPTNGLDPDGIKDIRNLIRTLAERENMAIIISSHNLAELQLVCDEIAVIDEGRLIGFKTMRELKQELDNNQRICFFVNYPNFAGQLIMQKYKINCKVAGSCVIVPISEQDSASVITYLTNKNIKIYKTRKITKSLEEVYFNILHSNRPSTSLF